MSTLQATRFVGGPVGTWRVESLRALRGASIEVVERLAIDPPSQVDSESVWILRGTAGSARYTERAEKTQLDALSPPLGRPEATCAALIPIRKTAAWWALAQDERRAIFETRSRHIADSMRFLPRIARRLHHGRDLGEPFDFLTWFEFAPEHTSAFDELVALLREREEWNFVDREIDIRLTRPR